MAPLKQLGDLAELKIATDLVSRGYQVAIPFGENNDFDLVLIRRGSLERVQVKHARSDGKVIEARGRSHSLTNGRVRHTKYYTSEVIDWLAVFDATSRLCCYIPAALLGRGKSTLSLRLTQPANNQRIGIRYAADFASPDAAARLID